MNIHFSSYCFKKDVYETSFKKKKRDNNKPLLQYDTDTYGIRSVEYKKPVTLKKALYDILSEKEINEGIVGEKATIQRFIRDLENMKKLLRRKVVRLAGYGSTAAAFETANGEIIKLTDGNHFPWNRPLKRFDVPVYQKGHSGRTHFYVEEMLYQHNLPDYYVEIVRDEIKAQGFRPVDLFCGDRHQVGVSKKGIAYLADPECARYKTVFHAIFDKAKERFKYKV